MKKLLFIAILAALGAAGSASAKEIRSLSVCGTSGCTSAAPGDERVGAMWSAFDGDGPNGGLGAVHAAVPASQFYKLGVGIRGDGRGGGFSVELWYVKPDLVKWVEHEDGTAQPFRRLSPVGAELVQELARDVEPFPVPRVIGATVDDQPVAQPARLIDLFAGERAGASASGGTQTATLYLRPGRANPWFSGSTHFLYVPDTQVLMLSEPIRVGRDVASLIADTGGFPEPPAADGAEWTRRIGVGIAALAVLVAATLFLLRRRPRDAKRAQPTTA